VKAAGERGQKKKGEAAGLLKEKNIGNKYVEFAKGKKKDRLARKKA